MSEPWDYYTPKSKADLMAEYWDQIDSEHTKSLDEMITAFERGETWSTGANISKDIRTWEEVFLLNPFPPQIDTERY